jgi:hypothetical protein
MKDEQPRNRGHNGGAATKRAADARAMALATVIRELRAAGFTCWRGLVDAALSPQSHAWPSRTAIGTFVGPKRYLGTAKGIGHAFSPREQTPALVGAVTYCRRRHCDCGGYFQPGDVPCQRDVLYGAIASDVESVVASIPRPSAAGPPLAGSRLMSASAVATARPRANASIEQVVR